MDWYRSSRESPEMRARAAHHFKSRRTSIVERNDVIQAMKILAVRLVALQETLLTNSDSSQLSGKRSTTGRFPANLKRPPPLPSDADWTTLRARLDLAQTLKIGGTVETVDLYRARSRLYRSQILQVNMRLKALAEEGKKESSRRGLRNALLYTLLKSYFCRKNV